MTLKPILTGMLTIALLLSVLGQAGIAASPTSSTGVGTSKKVASTWKKFTAIQGRYTILMPGQPKTSSVPLTLPQGMTIKLWITAGQEPSDAVTNYIAAYADFPIDGVINDKLGKAVLDAGIKNLLSQGNRRETSRSRFTLEGYPGQEVRYTGPNGMVGRVRVFMVESRMYVLEVETDRRVANEKKITNFLQSFKLL